MKKMLRKKDGSEIAYHKIDRTKPDLPGVVFLGGFHSDMSGSKACYLEACCKRWGNAYVRFDYFAHGETPGDFAQGTIGRWLDDTLAIIDELTEGPQILVGSSMGGWIMLLATLKRLARVKGLVGIAAAPDFLDDIERLSIDQHQALVKHGVCYIPAAEGDPYPITENLVTEGRNHRVLTAPIAIHCPVRLLHGLADPDVPWQKSIEISELILSEDVIVTLIKDGDHRLSNDQQLKILGDTVFGLFN